MPPQEFQLPPQAYDTINNLSPALPNVSPQVSTIITQGRMSRLNAATTILSDSESAQEDTTQLYSRQSFSNELLGGGGGGGVLDSR